MSNCNGCYSGCVQIISDRCVKYTGDPIVFLSINTGDPLSTVEQQILTYLGTVLDGTGIIPAYDDSGMCGLVHSYLPVQGDITLNDVLTALVNSVCELSTRMIAAEATLTTLNANYNVDCLDDYGVTDSMDTHDVLQGTINAVCEALLQITGLTSNFTLYVTLSELNTKIQEYLDSISTSTLMSSKMVPYVALPFYGDTSGKFDANGVGYGDWLKVYICNAYNGLTPDMRGFSPVGATASAGGGAPAPLAGGPYTVNVAAGEKQVYLQETQIPAHTHTLDAGGEHTHTVIAYADTDANSGVLVGGGTNNHNDGEFTTPSAGSHTHTVNPAGGPNAHNNIPPVLPCHFIMYIP